MERSADEFLVDSTAAVSRRSVVRRLGSGGLLAAAAAIAPVSLVGAQGALSEDEGTALADRIVGRFNANDLEGLGKLFAPDVVGHTPFPVPGTGAQKLLLVFRLAKTVVPDATLRLDDLLVAEDRIIALGTVTGTQTGGILGFPITGTPLEFSAIFVARVAGGKVAELWAQYDLVAVALQLANAGDTITDLLDTLLQPPAAATPVAAGTSLDDLVAIPGVVFALEFGNDGSVIDYKSSVDIPQEEIDQAAKAGPTLNALVAAAATRYNDISVLEWAPPSWVVYSGGDRWSAVLAGNHALFAETANTDFNALAKALGVQA
jgi:roadblock/LC7 domain-containing protein/predicted ester cyclase